MNKQEAAAEKIVDDFVQTLSQALDNKSEDRRKIGSNFFFATPVWFFLALFAMFVNVIMVAIIFWQRMRIDYLITKIIG